MNKRIIVLLLSMLFAFSLCACDSTNESTLYTRKHKEPQKTMLAIQSGDIRNYEQLTESLEGIIGAGIKSKILTVVNYNGVLVDDLERVTDYLVNQYPLGVFSVASIVYNPNFIATYCELEVIVSYSRTYNEINSIVPISEKSDLYNRMADMIETQDFHNSYEIYGLKLETEMLIEAFDKQWANSGAYAYGINDLKISFYPAEFWDEYILDIEYSYTDRLLDVLDIVNRTQEKAEEVAEKLKADTVDKEIDLVLEYFLENVAYDTQASRVIEETDGRQAKSSIYTATGALLENRAAQSGIAIGASLLLEELGIENTVICGRENGIPYYWIFLEKDGKALYLDPCAVYTDRDLCFLSEEDAYQRFTWNTELYATE